MMTDEEIREFLEGKAGKKAVVKKVSFQPLAPPVTKISAGTGISRLEDVEVEVLAELGQKTLKIRDILNLSVGSVIELEKPAGDPLDVKINNLMFARGEIMVYGDKFEVRVSSLLPPPVPGKQEGG